MAKKILITGGIKSGKSSFALNLARKYKGQKTFLATARAFDKEMSEKIEKHKAERGNDFVTLEEHLRIGKILENTYSLLVIDCVTIWLSNFYFEAHEREIEKYKNEFLEKLSKYSGNLIVVTNEVGSGIIPENSLSRKYQSELGKINQKIGEICDEVYFLVSGISMRVK